MVLKIFWAQTRITWAFEKSIFKFFASFWVKKLKFFFGKVRQSVQNYLNQNLVIQSFLKNGFGRYLELKSKCFKRSNRAFLSFFGIFWVEKLKAFTEKVRGSLKNYLNHNLVIDSFLEYPFLATMNSKTIVLILWKDNFPLFCK